MLKKISIENQSDIPIHPQSLGQWHACMHFAMYRVFIHPIAQQMVVLITL